MSYCGPSGPREARLAVVGEAPGANELIDGIPFTGASGRLLWTLLAEVGIRREECYCTNVIKTAAPPSPLASMPMHELCLWRDALLAELAQCTPCVLIALGNTALWALCGEQGVSNWRGSVLQTTSGVKCIPAYHPAAILRRPEDLHTLQHDLRIAVSESFTPELRSPSADLRINPSLREALEHITQAHRSLRVAFDIETARGGITTCISLCCERSGMLASMSIPMAGLEYWNTAELASIYLALQELLGSPEVVKIGQNVSYDIIGLRSAGITVAPPYIDTMHMHHAIDPGVEREDVNGKASVSHSLAFQASMYLNRPFWKDWDIAPSVPLAGKLDEYFRYNALDSLGTYELASIYEQSYAPAMRLYHRRYATTLPHLIQMYEDGLVLDDAKRKALNTQLRTQAQHLEQMVAQALGVAEFNVKSPAKLKHVLYDLLGFPRQWRRVAGGAKRLTTDEDALLEIYLQTQNTFILRIRDCIKWYKLASFLEPSSTTAQQKRRTWDGRLRCEYKFEVATGRLSSSASTASRVGINLQQIPGLIRQIFIPAPGYLFMEPDYAQIQARIVAWDSEDADMMHLFSLPPAEFDIHWHNAEIIMEKPRSELTKADRNVCKHIVYGSFFDMQEVKLQKTVLKYTASGPDGPLYIPLDECKRRQEVFKSKVPKFLARQERIRHEVLTTGRQVSPSGRIVTYHEIIPSRYKFLFGRRNYADTFRSAYSMIPQDIEADIVNTALTRIDTSLRQALLGRVAMQVHDSLLLEVKDNENAIIDAFTLASVQLSVPYTIRGNPMVVPVEWKLSRAHWPCGQSECLLERSSIRTLEEVINAYHALCA